MPLPHTHGNKGNHYCHSVAALHLQACGGTTLHFLYTCLSYSPSAPAILLKYVFRFSPATWAWCAEHGAACFTHFPCSSAAQSARFHHQRAICKYNCKSKPLHESRVITSIDLSWLRLIVVHLGKFVFRRIAAHEPSHTPWYWWAAAAPRAASKWKLLLPRRKYFSFQLGSSEKADMNWKMVVRLSRAADVAAPYVSQKWPRSSRYVGVICRGRMSVSHQLDATVSTSGGCFSKVFIQNSRSIRLDWSQLEYRETTFGPTVGKTLSKTTRSSTKRSFDHCCGSSWLLYDQMNKRPGQYSPIQRSHCVTCCSTRHHQGASDGWFYGGVITAS